MTEDTYRLIDLIMKFLGGLIAFGGAWVAYRGFRQQVTENRDETRRANTQREDDLKWRRAEFIIRLWKEFNDDKSLRPCIVLIDSGDDARLSRVLLGDLRTLSEADTHLRYDFDRYFDFFDSIAYCVDKTPFTEDEAGCFGWHFEKLRTTAPVREYCENNGYQDVVKLADRLRRRT